MGGFENADSFKSSTLNFPSKTFQLFGSHFRKPQYPVYFPGTLQGAKLPGPPADPTCATLSRLACAGSFRYSVHPFAPGITGPWQKGIINAPGTCDF